MQMIAMIKHQLKLMFRNRLAIFATITVPLILTFLFSFSQSSDKQEKLYLVDADNSVYSNQLIEMIQEHKNVKTINVTENNLKKKIDDQDIPFGLVIEKDFGNNISPGEDLKIKFIENYENGSGVLLKQLITNEVGTLKKVIEDSKYVSEQLGLDDEEIAKNIFRGIKDSSQITLNDKTLSNGQKEQDNTTARLIGFLVMFIWFVVIQGLRTLIDEKENNTFSRLLSTPVNYHKYIVSKMAATYIVGIVHVIVIILAGKYLLKIGIGHNVFAIGLILSVYLFALISITMIMIPFMKSQKQFTSSASIIIAVSGMVGGSFYSLEIAPKYMQSISKFTPEAWAIQSLNDVIFNKSPIGSELIPIGIFIGIGLLSLIVSYLLISREMKTLNS
ncbi:ABC transporter permease [Bacillus thuringiensis]|nr:ABC-2 type transport system permease protein [Bacillus cereus]PER60995.1 ABC transporter permease [Bacillus thuringiensis]OBW85559.1 multidrug ABC transporter [Bacillus cereus]PES39929.1 ABC transporter permease [Bacillus thuringiensis]PEV68054.1 ABC transporter permease [Bacillus thuringiensis]